MTVAQKLSPETTVYRSDPAFIAGCIVNASGCEIDRLKYWACPCCDQVKAVIVEDRGVVWFGMVESFRDVERSIIRIDHRSEVDELPASLAHRPDVALLAVWYQGGLYDELARCFAS
jgi:hypothetical protein